MEAPAYLAVLAQGTASVQHNAYLKYNRHNLLLDTTYYTEAFSISIELGLHGHGHSRFAVILRNLHIEANPESRSADLP